MIICYHDICMMLTHRDWLHPHVQSVLHTALEILHVQSLSALYFYIDTRGIRPTVVTECLLLSADRDERERREQWRPMDDCNDTSQ